MSRVTATVKRSYQISMKNCEYENDGNLNRVMDRKCGKLKIPEVFLEVAHSVHDKRALENSNPKIHNYSVEKSSKTDVVIDFDQQNAKEERKVYRQLSYDLENKRIQEEKIPIKKQPRYETEHRPEEVARYRYLGDWLSPEVLKQGVEIQTIRHPEPTSVSVKKNPSYIYNIADLSEEKLKNMRKAWKYSTNDTVTCRNKCAFLIGVMILIWFVSLVVHFLPNTKMEIILPQ